MNGKHMGSVMQPTIIIGGMDKKVQNKIPDISKLEEIPSLKGYYMDVEKLEVWSLKRRSSAQKKVWYKMKVSSMRFNAWLGGKCKKVSVPKSLFCINHNISYYDKRITHYHFRILDGNVCVEDESEAARRALKLKREEFDRNRVKHTEHYIKVLQMLLLAYKGFPSKIMQYVHRQRKPYINGLMRKGLSHQMAEDGYDMACDKLADVISYGGSIIKNFDSWFITTAYWSAKKEVIRNKFSVEEYEQGHVKYYK